MRQSIISFAGVGEDGRDLFDIDLTIPDVGDDTVSPTKRMVAAVERDFRLPPDFGLNDEQVHAMLTARDFGRAVVERETPDLYGPPAKHFAIGVAAFILSDRDRAVTVMRMMDRRFDRAADPGTLPSAVSRLDGYPDISRFVHDAFADLREAGARF